MIAEYKSISVRARWLFRKSKLELLRSRLHNSGIGFQFSRNSEKCNIIYTYTVLFVKYESIIVLYIKESGFPDEFTFTTQIEHHFRVQVSFRRCVFS